MKSHNLKSKEGRKEIKCIFCKLPIHVDNWGGVIKDGFFCTNIICLIELQNKLSK